MDLCHECYLKMELGYCPSKREEQQIHGIFHLLHNYCDPFHIELKNYKLWVFYLFRSQWALLSWQSY